MTAPRTVSSRVRIIRYATGTAPRWLYFHLDETPGTIPVGMYCWLIEHPDGPILVDTGIDGAETAARFGSEPNPDWLDPVALVAEHVDPGDIRILVITHTHWDHLTPRGIASFPNATVVMQRREIEARMYPPHPSFRALAFSDFIDTMPALLGPRLRLIDGDAEIAPGVRALLLGGHTLGLQAVVVETAAGRVAIASDLVPAYANIERDLATCLHENLLQCWRGMERVRRHADIVLPGHDAAVLDRHPTGVVG